MGKVIVWGKIGGPAGQPGARPAVADIMGLPPITSIAAGQSHALMTDGERVWALGRQAHIAAHSCDGQAAHSCDGCAAFDACCRLVGLVLLLLILLLLAVDLLLPLLLPLPLLLLLFSSEGIDWCSAVAACTLCSLVTICWCSSSVVALQLVKTLLLLLVRCGGDVLP